MSTAAKPVKKLNDEKIRADKKKQADQKKLEDKNAASTAKDALQTSQALKRRVVTGGSFLLGNDELDKAPAIATLTSDAEYSKFLNSTDSLNPLMEPFMLTGSSIVAEVTKNKDNAGKWLGLWHSCGIFDGAFMLVCGISFAL